jgi:hypothetical protein
MRAQLMEKDFLPAPRLPVGERDHRPFEPSFWTLVKKS